MGVDNSEQRLAIARQRCPVARFELADMRTLTMNRQFDAVLITARSISYIIQNQDVLATFRHISPCLANGGKLIFDFIDVGTFFASLDESALVEHWATHDGQNYLRQSRYVVNVTTGLAWDWHSAFFIESADNNRQPIATDVATLRAFLSDEMRILLQLSGFSIIQELHQPTYAFDTLVVVAEKNNHSLSFGSHLSLNNK